MALSLPGSWGFAVPSQVSHSSQAATNTHGPRALGAAAMLAHGAFRTLAARRTVNRGHGILRVSKKLYGFAALHISNS